MSGTTVFWPNSTAHEPLLIEPAEDPSEYRPKNSSSHYSSSIGFNVLIIDVPNGTKSEADYGDSPHSSPKRD
jgi:hypothetical protein